MVETCASCEREFTSQKNFKRHAKSCKTYKNYLTGLLSHKRELDDAAEASRATRRLRVASPSADTGAYQQASDEVSYHSANSISILSTCGAASNTILLAVWFPHRARALPSSSSCYTCLSLWTNHSISLPL